MKPKRETRLRGYGQYHISYFQPSDMWPDGGWAVYRITGDEIAERIIWNEYDIEKGYPRKEKGIAVRHSWCGYLGTVDSFDKIRDLIEADAKEVVVFVTHEDA